MQKDFVLKYVPNMLLIPAVRGISDWDSSATPGSNPSESNAMRFEPWLLYDSTSNDFMLSTQDTSGGVFGFRYRTSKGSYHGTTQKYFRLHTSLTDTVAFVALDSVAPDDQLRMWRHKSDHLYRQENTRMMLVSVSFRASGPDYGGAEDDTLFVIELPYRKNNDSAGLITFACLPIKDSGVVKVKDAFGSNVGMMTVLPVTNGDFTVNASGTKKFAVLRWMLRKHFESTSSIITVSAGFQCDYTKTIGGDTMDWKTADHNNPRFAYAFGGYGNVSNSIHEHDSSRISRIGVRLIYYPKSGSGNGIDLFNIRIATPHADRFLWGKYDKAIQDSVNEYVTNVHILNTGDTISGYQSPVTDYGKRAKIWKFYGRDEAMPMQWLAFRYMNRKLDGRLITEVSSRWSAKQRHVMEQETQWQGEGMQCHNQIASYAYKHGYNRVSETTDASTQESYANLRFGFEDLRVNGSLSHNPDSFLKSREHSNGIPPLPFPDVPDSTGRYLSGYPGGILAYYEYIVKNFYANEATLLFGNKPWMANVWLNSFMTATGGTSPKVVYRNARAKSATELRLAMWMPIMLGCHGIMIYKGESGFGSGFTLPQNPSEHSEGVGVPRVTEFETGLYHSRDPLDTTFDLTSLPIDSILYGSVLGDDYFYQNDTSHIDAYFKDGFTTFLDSLNGGPVAGVYRLYSGVQSARLTTNEVCETINQMQFKLGGKDDTTTSHPLATMQLRGWWGKGFTKFVVEHPSSIGCVLERIDTSRSRMKARHPRRLRDYVPQSDAPGHYDYESYDSLFIDVTLHSFKSDTAMDSSWVVGVLNRRTDPRMQAHDAIFNNSDSAEWNFTTYNDWRDSVSQYPSTKYAQRGARRITIPFSYTAADGRYRLLRLRELGGGLDTVVGQDREITLDFLPGQGRMLRVDVIPGDERGTARGWLDHNTQRKIVVFPVSAGDTVGYRSVPSLATPDTSNTECSGTPFVRMKHGSDLRYHMVYHRRLNPNQPMGTGNPLGVYYRRSEPLKISGGSDSSFADGGGVEWEPEILVSTHFYGTHNLVDTPSCAFPSVVVRYDPISHKSLAYVVYACSQDTTQSNLNDIAICEAVLPADTIGPSAQQSAFATMQYGSRVLDEVRSRRPLCALNDDRLRYWGTPMVSAAIDGNYYCWSDNIRGIVYGFKRPMDRTFVSPVLQNVRFTQMQTGQALYPTLNSYSRLEIGETDCSMAWQEGSPTYGCDFGSHIYYTHLNYDVGTNQLSRRLRLSGGYKNTSGLSTLDVVNGVPRCAILSQGTANDYNGKPTLYRSLSDYDQSGFDGTGAFLDSIGILNHKADRIGWVNAVRIANPVNPPTWERTRIGRRVVDVMEYAPCTTLDTAMLWSNGIGYIVDTNDLSAPEFSLGEQKTVVYGVPLAESWDNDDTSMVLTFQQDVDGAPTTKNVWHVAFGWDLAGIAGSQYLPQDPDSLMQLNERSYVKLISEKGRHPHASTRHSVTHMQGLTKNRRIYEQLPFTDAGHAYAPSIGLSVEGFFKRDLAHEKRLGSESASRVFVGYRSDELEALVSAISINDNSIPLLPESRSGGLKLDEGSIRLVSEWHYLPESSELRISSIASGTSATDAQIVIERESDNSKLPLPVFNVQGAVQGQKSKPTSSFTWDTYSDPAMRYRLVLTTNKKDARIVKDLELHPVQPEQTMSKQGEASPILDLRRMRALDGLTGSSNSDQTIEIIPQPAREYATVIIRGGVSNDATGDVLTIVNVDGSVVATIAISNHTHQVVHIDVSKLAPGVYSVNIGRSKSRAVMCVVH
ncbi:MAG: hypothetical protein KA339_04405 [Candidatus Kapabacteria bacterium]|nr:hypothetical protein [Ignavibacteria bacterium]MBP6509776.1 hypothetical protein [Candidatus Kapabacteria bacterium]